MTTQIIREEVLVSMDEIREMAEHAGPCVTIYLAREGVGSNRPMGGGRMKTALQEVTRRIDAARETETFLKPLRKLAEAELKDARYANLAIFHSPGYLKVVRCEQPLTEGVYVGDRFHILPGLAAVLEPVRFNLLALSRKHVRLLACSRNSCEQVALPEGLATSVAAEGAFDRPDHDLENRSSAGPDRGKGKILFGTGANREDAYLYNFFKSIDRGLHPILTRSGLPLIVAAVGEELTIYGRANTYPNLVKAGIQMSPERVPDRELQTAGVEIFQEHYREGRRRTRKHFEELGGREAILTSIGACIDAAREGHIGHLLLADGVQRDGEELNRIALDTILHGGRISLTAADEMAEKRSRSRPAALSVGACAEELRRGGRGPTTAVRESVTIRVDAYARASCFPRVAPVRARHIEPAKEVR